MAQKENKGLRELQKYVDGEANTVYEFAMLIIITINTISLGIETSKNISQEFRNILFIIDQICLWIFILELLFKIIVYNKEFFGKIEYDENSKKNYIH